MIQHTTLTNSQDQVAVNVNAGRQSEISARLDRLPLTKEVFLLRNVVGAATFFDSYTVIAIAYAMPVLVKEWGLRPEQTGSILSSGYLGQMVGALFFGWLAERVGRLKVLLFAVLLFVGMQFGCLFATGAATMIAFRFLQGIGTGSEVPVASAYINEYLGSQHRGRFFLLYEVMFLLGLVAAGLLGSQFVPLYGWKAMFIIGLIPALIMLPLRLYLKESPRWLATRGRYAEAEQIVEQLEQSARTAGHTLEEPTTVQNIQVSGKTSDWRELFQGIYLKRTLTIWAIWFTTYMVANGLLTWLPTLYKQVFHLPLKTSLLYGTMTSIGGVILAVVCALLIDQVGRKRWYTGALLLAPLPLLGLAFFGVHSALNVLIFAGLAYAILQTVTFSLYLYSAELYPTRLRAVGTGFGSAWLRLGSFAGPLVVGALMQHANIQWVFGTFGVVLLISALITIFFAVETKGRSLDELSP